MGDNLAIDRRTFLKSAALAGAGVALASYLPGEKTVSAAPTFTPPTVTHVSHITPTVVPNFSEVIDVDEGTELMLAAFAANGIERIYFHGGTDTAFFMNAVAKFKEEGKATPEIVMSISPSLPALQLTLVTIPVIIIAAGSVKVYESDIVAPLSSVTKTSYVPAVNPV